MSLATPRPALRLLLAAWLAALLPGALSGAGESPAAPPADAPEAVAPAAPDASTMTAIDGQLIVAEPVEEPDLAEQPLSNAARVRLDRARESIVLVRGFFGGAATSAFHGSGFVASDDGLIITNYHVVSEAVLHPRRYRLEYVTSDNRRGTLKVHAVDVRNDLAVVKAAEDLGLPPLRVRTDIPRAGARAYSIGFPLNLGLTITEGVANGVVGSGLDQRIHYTGAINSGMSGGPALDAGGTVYGVNVSVVTGRQLVGFVVPARHIAPLLRRAGAPLDDTRSATQLRALVAQQALAYEGAVLDPWPTDNVPRTTTSQAVFGYQLPTRIGPGFDCTTTGSSEARDGLQTESISCTARTGVLLLLDMEVGRVAFQHRVLRAQRLHPLQFAQRVTDIAGTQRREGSPLHVAPFACRDALVSLDGFDARVTTCARQYRLFLGLYDLAVTVASINSTERAVVSQLDLRGVSFDAGMQFVRRFLGAMQWNP